MPLRRCCTIDDLRTRKKGKNLLFLVRAPLGIGERSLLEHALVSYSIVWHLKEEMEHSDWKR